jgi:hypothetical protein
VASLLALVWSLAGLVAPGLDDLGVSVTSDTRVKRTLAPPATSTTISVTTSTSSSPSTSPTSTSLPLPVSTLGVPPTTLRVPPTRPPVTVATTTTLADVEPTIVEEICPEGLHPDGSGYCVP